MTGHLFFFPENLRSITLVPLAEECTFAEKNVAVRITGFLH